MPASLPSVTGSQLPNMFHKTLGAVWSATLDSQKPVWPEYLAERTTVKRWFDDVELVDPALWGETSEGEDIKLDSYGEGYVVRYRPIKFAQRLGIPNEIIDDAQYEECTDAVAMMGRTWVQTQDVYAVGVIDNAANTNIVGGDGVTYANNAHPLRSGATQSNILEPAVLPSNQGVQLLVVAAEKIRGGNGFIAGVKTTKAWGPTNHRHRLKEVLKSEKRDDTANNAINALKGDLSADPVSIPHMASSTNWGTQTNAMRGASWVWRQKATFKDTQEIKNDSQIFVGKARAFVFWSNWRDRFFSLA